MVNTVSQNDLHSRLAALRGYKSKIAGSSLQSGYRPVVRHDGPDHNNLKKDEHMTHDMILPSNPKTKIQVAIEQSSKVPEYAIRGMKGDTNSSFFEFLKVAKIPYYVGGPVLGWCFAAGGRKAKPMAKQIGVGVALYYAAAALAEKLITTPVKLAKGIDINQPYRKIVATTETTHSGLPKKKVEYHNVYESADFTRWDLMYDYDNAKNQKAPRTINSTYEQLAKKMGIKKDTNDSDTLIKDEIKKSVIKSRAWTYAMALPLGVAAIGIGSDDEWKNLGNDNAGSIKNRYKNAYTTEIASFKSQMKKAEKKLNRLTEKAKKAGRDLTSKEIESIKYPNKFNTAKNIAKNIGHVTNEKFIAKLAKSTKSYWKTTSGKLSMIGAGVVLVGANISLLSTKVRKKDVQDYNNYPSTLREINYKEVKND